MATKTSRAPTRAPRRRAARAPETARAHAGNEWGRIVEITADGGLRVEVGGVRVLARSVVPLDARVAQQAIEAKTPVLCTFAGGAPVIIGLERAVELKVQLPKRPEHAKVDGKRVTLSADDEIELKCGKASITLRRNGRLVIRGAYVETSSAGINRIKGGAVQIN